MEWRGAVRGTYGRDRHDAAPPRFRNAREPYRDRARGRRRGHPPRDGPRADPLGDGRPARRSAQRGGRRDAHGRPRLHRPRRGPLGRRDVGERGAPLARHPGGAQGGARGGGEGGRRRRPPRRGHRRLTRGRGGRYPARPPRPLPMPNDDQQRLEALKRFFVLDHTESEEETARLVRVAAQVYGVAYAVLTLREGEDERVAAAYGFDPAALPEDAVFCERAAGPSIPLTVADASDDARFAKNPLVHGPQAARFYAGVPLKSADGFTLGTLALLDPTAQELNGEGLAML